MPRESDRAVSDYLDQAYAEGLTFLYPCFTVVNNNNNEKEN